MGLIVIDDWLLLATLLASQRMQDEPRACAGYAACASPLPSPFSSRYTNWPKSASRAFIVHLAIILCNLFSLSLIELNLQNLQIPAASATRACHRSYPDPSRDLPDSDRYSGRRPFHDARRINQCRTASCGICIRRPPALICLMCIHGTVSGHQSCCTRF